MNLRRTGAIAKKVLRGLRRDRRTLALAIVAPVFAMLVFGYVFGAEVRDVDVAVVVQDEGTLAERIVANLSSDVVRVHRYDSWDAAQADVADAKLRAAVLFPANFSADASPRAGPTGPLPPAGARVATTIDGTNSQEVQALRRELLQAAQETLAAGRAAPLTIDDEFAHAQGAQYIDFFVPGILAFAALMFTTLLTVLAFVGERTSGTLARLLVTPVRESEIVAGYALAFSLVAFAQAVALIVMAVVVFDALIVGSLALVVLIVVLMALDALSLGILLSSLARREAQAVQLFPLVAFPTFLLSGIFIPTENLPAWLSPLAWLLPPTYAVEAMRDVMLRGWGLDRIWPEVAALAAFAVVFLAFAVVGLRGDRVRG